MPFVLLAVAGLVIAWLVWRANQALWSISVEDGRVVDVAGQPPVGFLNAVRDIVASPPVARGRISARRAEGGAVLDVSGIHAGQRQRLQNVFRLEPTSRLVSSPNPVNEQSARRVLSLAWLLSLFRRW